MGYLDCQHGQLLEGYRFSQWIMFHCHMLGCAVMQSPTPDTSPPPRPPPKGPPPSPFTSAPRTTPPAPRLPPSTPQNPPKRPPPSPVDPICEAPHSPVPQTQHYSHCLLFILSQKRFPANFRGRACLRPVSHLAVQATLPAIGKGCLETNSPRATVIPCWSTAHLIKIAGTDHSPSHAKWLKTFVLMSCIR